MEGKQMRKPSIRTRALPDISACRVVIVRIDHIFGIDVVAVDIREDDPVVIVYV
jgi:hypothetical protein